MNGLPYTVRQRWGKGVLAASLVRAQGLPR